MTTGQKDRAWQALPEEMREEICKDFTESRQVCESMYDSGWNDAASSILLKLFGKGNLTSKNENKAELVAADPKCEIAYDWTGYKMELAKELAAAALSRKGCIDPKEIMEDVDCIVERLKRGIKDD